jgi:hypothetical protein
MPASRQINVSILLPLRNQAELHRLLDRLYNPSSPDYRHFLSVEEFTAQFGPTAENYQAVVDFAQANGFTVADRPANRMVVSVSGTVAQVEKAFNVRMNFYRHPTENRTFFSPDREPSLELNVPVAHIVGLNNFSIPRPMVIQSPAASGRANAAAGGSGPGGAYLSSDMRAAYYGGTALTGSGQVVGVAQFDGYNISDVVSDFAGTAASFANGRNYILDYTPTAGGATYRIPINNVLLDGATGAPGQFISPADDLEQALDIAQAIGMAPGLSQVRVYIGNSDADILNAMASENLARQLSISWLWNPDDPSTDDFIFQEMAAQGQSIFACSGDWGAYSPVFSYYYPAEDAWITSVGGTDLVTNGAGGSWKSEAAWSRSGGGISPDSIPIPSWQAGVVNASNGGSTTLRNGPDVAAEAEGDNYSCDMGVCEKNYGGTSFAAPRWAGFMALVNQQSVTAGNPAVGLISPVVYAIGRGSSYSSDLHDITSGNNSYYYGEPFFNAVSGYDLVTGWGSPNGQNLIDALAPPASAGFQLSASPSSLTIDPGTSATTTITVHDVGGFRGGVNLSVSGLPDGVTASFGTNPATGSSVLTLTVSGTIIRGSYLLAITGASGTRTATCPIALEVNAPGFSIAPMSSAMEIYAGSSGTDFIAVTDYPGFTGSVRFAVTSALPSGVTASWEMNPSAGSSALILTASDSATNATEVVYALLTITGSSGDLTAITTIALTVHPASYFLEVSPYLSSIVAGSSGTATITAVPAGDFADTITLSATQLPSGVTAAFNPIHTTGTSVLTLTASASAPLETSSVAIKSNGSHWGGAVSFSQQVIAAPMPTYTIGVSPAFLTLAQGASGTTAVTVDEMGGFTGSVNLYATFYSLNIGASVTPGVTATFTPNPTTKNSVLTLTAACSAAPGIYDVSIWNADDLDGVYADFYLTVKLNPVPCFTLDVSPATLTLAPGASVATAITMTPQNEFTRSVSLAASGLPNGVTASFSPNRTTGFSALTLTASSAVLPGKYSVKIAATEKNVSVNTALALNVEAVATTTALSIAPSGGSLAVGASYTLTATVSPASGSATPTGNLVFTVGSATRTVALNSSGVATYSGTAPTATGALMISASYQGTAEFSASTSNPLNEAVLSIPTSTVLSITPSGGFLAVGAPYTLTATVSPASGSTKPTGDVVFTIGSATRTAALNSSGVATYSGTAPTTAGALTISASYQGTAEFSASTSNALNEIVRIPGFTVSGTAVTVTPGATTGNTSIITVTPVNGFTGTVNLSCDLSPTAASDPARCSLFPASVAISGAAQTSTLTVNSTAPATCSSMVHPQLPGEPWYAAGGATLACLLLFGIPARRRSWRTVLGGMTLFVALSSGIFACGGGGGGGNNCIPNSGTTAGTYTITVTGASGTLTATNTVTLTVQ